MLLQQSQLPGAPETLKGVERTVDYLQRLGKSHIDTILEYAAWVIKSDPDMGLSVSADFPNHYVVPLGITVYYVMSHYEPQLLVQGKI